ncbi:hypothetical protein PORY_000930 [Pneumocystis oryctolagi]|uniref:Uncharacterized protein n=1 Tax=Pneumocystis oryctolagi TaxID=42067 RepID=A0ACB7CIB7_9ASCO|nr:hypothetical protein PORY_000930 [Pneumocystis oryctolagi]
MVPRDFLFGKPVPEGSEHGGVLFHVTWVVEVANAQTPSELVGLRICFCMRIFLFNCVKLQRKQSTNKCALSGKNGVFERSCFSVLFEFFGFENDKQEDKEIKVQRQQGMTEDGSAALSFCNHFWGKDDRGVNVLFNRMNEAKTICEEVRSATIEEEYSRRLHRLVRGTLCSHEIGTLRESFTTLQKETEMIAKQHSNIALQIRNELEEPLHAFSSDMRATRKTIQSNLEKLRRIKTAQEQQVQKCKEKIEDKGGKSNAYSSQSNSFLGKSSDKNNSKIDKSQIMAQNNNDYMLAITVLQETSIKWIREWKIACDKFQDLEERRLSFIKSGLWTFSTIISATCLSDKKCCEKIRESIEKCNPQNDIQLFIRTKGTGQEIPNPPKPRDPRDGFEDLNEPPYSIAQFFRVSDPQFHSDAMMQRSILNENSAYLSPKTFSLSETQTELSSKTNVNEAPLDGITQFCKNDSLVSSSSNTKSSPFASIYPHSGETRENTSFFGFKDYNKKDTSTSPGLVNQNRHSLNSNDKRSEFVSSFEESSTSIDKTAKIRSRSSSPFKNFSSKRGHEMKSSLLERLKGMGVVSDSEAEPIDPRANVMLNVGNNMFEVNSDVKKQKSDFYDRDDPVVSALAQFKVSSKTPLSTNRESAKVTWHDSVDKNHSQNPETVERRNCFSTEQSRRLSSNSQSLPMPIPQRPNLSIPNKLVAQRDTLDAPFPAVTAEKMKHISQGYVKQMKDIYGSSEKNKHFQYDMMQINDRDPYYNQVRGDMYMEKEPLSMTKDKMLNERHYMLENRRVPLVSGKPSYVDSRPILRAASPQPQYRDISPDHDYSRPDPRSTVYKSASPSPQYVSRIERPIESLPNSHIQRSLTPGPSMRSSDQYYGYVSRQQPPTSSVFDVALDANGNVINKYSRARSASPCPGAHKPVPRNGYNYNVPTEYLPYANSVSNDYGDYYREDNRALNRASVHNDNRIYMGNGSSAPAQYTEDGRRILFYVRALYDYQATIHEEISFVKDDILLVLEMQEDGWWEGEVVNSKKPKRGLFPSNFVQHIYFILSIFCFTLFISMISYFLFYWYTIPSMEISKPIYFQYSDNSLWAHADFSSEKRFINEQSYNILLELFVPLSKFNIDIGNFMANIKLYSKLGILSISSRPAILTFSSSLLTKIRTFVMSPIFILGLLKEEERLIIPLVEEFKYYKTHETTLKFANITLSRNVQIYSSRLIFETQLHGIKRKTLGVIENQSYSQIPQPSSVMKKMMGIRGSVLGQDVSNGQSVPSNSQNRLFQRSSSNGNFIEGVHMMNSVQKDVFRNSRQSLAPSSARRSSVYTPGRPSNISFFSQTASQAPSKDPRPIRDKQYQLTCIHSILTYLSNSGFPQALTPKNLQQPTQKDFMTIFKWLYHRLDPNYQFIKKMDDEVITCIKNIKYPFADQISRSQLIAVGSPHSWPSMLSMLHWMVEVISCIEKLVNKEIYVDDNNDNEAERIFFDYLTKAYRVFLSGDDDFSEMEKELELEFEKRNEEILLIIERLEKENETLSETIKNITDSMSSVETLDKERLVLQSDKDKFNQYIQYLETKKKKFIDLNTRLRNELYNKEKELSQLSIEKSELQVQVDAQPISPADVDRMTAERESLVKNLEIVTGKMEESSRQTFEKEILVQKKMDSLEKLIANYNSLGYKIGIIPETAPYANNVFFELDFINPVVNHGNIRPDQLVNRDLKHDIRPKLQKLRQDLGTRFHKEQDEAIQLQDVLDKVCEGLLDARDELDVLQAKVSVIMVQYDEVKDNMLAESSASNAEIEKLERDLQQMRITSQNGLLQLEQRSQSISIEYDQLVHVINSLKEDLYREVIRMLDEVIKFKLHIQTSLESFENEVVLENENCNLDDTESLVLIYCTRFNPHPRLYKGCPPAEKIFELQLEETAWSILRRPGRVFVLDSVFKALFVEIVD